jgi:DNA-binding CsgD family transcriptional regulator
LRDGADVECEERERPITGSFGTWKEPLTLREQELLRLIAEGKNSREAASIMGITAKTADTHRANLMRKLQVHSVTELVRYAIRNHIVEV